MVAAQFISIIVSIHLLIDENILKNVASIIYEEFLRIIIKHNLTPIDVAAFGNHHLSLLVFFPNVDQALGLRVLEVGYNCEGMTIHFVKLALDK